MGLKINFRAGENTGQGNWTPLAEGDYLMEITDVELTTSKSNNQQLQVSMKIMDGVREGDACKDWYSLLPQSGWKLRGLLDALDIDYTVGSQDGDGRDDLEFDAEDLLQRRVEFYVTQRSYEGKTNNDFKNPKDPDAQAEGGEQQAQGQQQGQQQQQQNTGGGGGARRRPRPQR